MPASQQRSFLYDDARHIPIVQNLRPRNRDGFEIAIICALPVERNAVEALLDEEYETDGFSYGKAAGDRNAYTTGRLGNQHVVLAYMPGMGTTSAAAVAANLYSSFEGIKVGMVVGICGGVPTTAGGGEILLGDVIISTSVVQVDFGRQYPNKFIRKKEVEDTLGRANPELRSFIERMFGYLVQRRLKDKTGLFSTQICAKKGLSKSAYPGPEHDMLYPAEYRHKHQIPGCYICDDCKSQDDDICESALRSSCEELGCDNTLSMKRSRIQRAMGFTSDRSSIMAADIQEAQKPSIHFGRMASSNQVMKSGQHRDQIAAEEGVIGFEMESAGTWDFVPTIVIKSVCDYADSHKNKRWQQYAAATAAACTKAMLEEWRGVDRPGRNLADREHPGQNYTQIIGFNDGVFQAKLILARLSIKDIPCALDRYSLCQHTVYGSWRYTSRVRNYCSRCREEPFTSGSMLDCYFRDGWPG